MTTSSDQKLSLIPLLTISSHFWGGKLPSITDETYDLVMKGFDEWENGED